jgi:NitT/TauT family transport system substrate-binding protein
MTTTQTRRSFLAGLSALGVSATLPSSAAGSEGDLETTSVRFIDFGGAGCTVPQFVAEELLHAEGFSDIQYVYMGVNQSTISMMAKMRWISASTMPASSPRRSTKAASE